MAKVPAGAADGRAAEDFAAVVCRLVCVPGMLQQYRQQELANLVWSLARMGFADSAVLRQAVAPLSCVMEQLRGEELAQVRWAYAQPGAPPGPWAAWGGAWRRG